MTRILLPKGGSLISRAVSDCGVARSGAGGVISGTGTCLHNLGLA